MPIFILAALALAAFAATREPATSAPAPAPDAPAPVLRGSSLERLVSECTELLRAGKSAAAIKALMNGRGIGGADLDLALEVAHYRVASAPADDGTVS